MRAIHINLRSSILCDMDTGCRTVLIRVQIAGERCCAPIWNIHWHMLWTIAYGRMDGPSWTIALFKDLKFAIQFPHWL